MSYHFPQNPERHASIAHLCVLLFHTPGISVHTSVRTLPSLPQISFTKSAMTPFPTTRTSGYVCCRETIILSADIATIFLVVPVNLLTQYNSFCGSIIFLLIRSMERQWRGWRGNRHSDYLSPLTPVPSLSFCPRPCSLSRVEEW